MSSVFDSRDKKKLPAKLRDGLLRRLCKVRRSETARRFLKRSTVEPASLERYILISRLLVKRIIAFSRWSEVKPKTSDIQRKMGEI